MQCWMTVILQVYTIINRLFFVDAYTQLHKQVTGKEANRILKITVQILEIHLMFVDSCIIV